MNARNYSLLTIVGALVLGTVVALGTAGCSETAVSSTGPDDLDPMDPVMPGELSACISTEPNPARVAAGDVLVLDGRCSEGATEDATYHWELGDGRSRTGPRAEVTYEQPGDYVVELTVTDGGRGDTATVDVEVSASLAACFEYEHLPTSPDTPPCSVRLNASCSSGDVVEYQWFLEGGVPLPDRNVTTTEPTLVYSWDEDTACIVFRPFERLVRLTVVGSSGETASFEQFVEFTTEPIPF